MGLQILRYVLPRMPDARVRWPQSVGEFAEFARMVERRTPRAKNVWGFVDGLSCSMQSSTDPDEQNRNYNGWTCDSQIQNVLLFTPDGCIAWAALNAPGPLSGFALVYPVLGCRQLA